MKTTDRNALWILFIIIGSAVLFCTACTKYQFDRNFRPIQEVENPGECSLVDVSYESTVMPILQTQCQACHNSTSATAGYDYSDYDKVLNSAADGSLLGTIDNAQGYSPMPPGNSLDSCSIEKIRFWISSLDPDSIPPPDSVPGPGTLIPCDPDTVYFQNTILPLVVSSCATTGCHDQDSHREGIILTDYSSIISTGKIKPGDTGDSEFFESLTGDNDDLMPPPPNSPLTNEQISLIGTWIMQGAKNNMCSDGCDTTNVTFSETIWPMMELYCTGCHSVSAASGGIIIAGYDDMVALSNNGSLMGSVRYEPGYAGMPTNQPLSDCNISLLQAWIDKEYPE